MRCTTLCDKDNKHVLYFVSLSICMYVLLMEIQFSREEGQDPINWSNPATFMCLSQSEDLTSNIRYRFLLCCVHCVNMGRDSCCVDIGAIVELKTQISNLVHTTRLWNNLHQIRSKSKDWKAK